MLSLAEISPGPGFVRLSGEEGAAFTVRADQPGGAPRSELSLLGCTATGGYELGFRLDACRTRLVHARWGGVSLTTEAGWATLRAWGRPMARWAVGEALALEIAVAGDWFSSPRLRRRRRVRCPLPARHHAGLLWPCPHPGEALRTATLTTWRRDGADLLQLPVVRRDLEARW